MKEDLLTAKEKGKSALSSFVQDRLKTNATGFFDTLPKLKLGTFNEAAKRKSVTTKGKNVVLQADRNLFARLLVIGQSREMDIKDLLTHELGHFHGLWLLYMAHWPRQTKRFYVAW